MALGALHKIAGGDNGAIDGAAAGLFTAGIAARTKGKIFSVIACTDLPALALAQAGLPPDRVIYVEVDNDKTVLAYAGEDFRHGGLGAVASVWIDVERCLIPIKEYQRFMKQIGAQTGRRAALLWRFWRLAQMRALN